MGERSLEEVCKEYKLSEEEHQRIGNNINEIMLFCKEPSDNPIAIINIAPPGSGKTGLNGYSLKQIKNGNVVIINNDELKPFHPKAEEIARLYPQYYAKVINQESNPWTDKLFEKAVAERYNIIFEGTGRNLKLLKKMINMMSDYKIIVRGMAVNEINCLMSIIERYEGQVSQKGWGRIVSLDVFYKAYKEFLDTIDAFEKEHMVDLVEVYIRGEQPSTPIRIYNSRNKEFDSAKIAVLKGREDDKKTAKQYYDNVFKKKEFVNTEDNEKRKILEKLDELSKGNSLEERW